MVTTGLGSCAGVFAAIVVGVATALPTVQPDMPTAKTGNNKTANKDFLRKTFNL